MQMKTLQNILRKKVSNWVNKISLIELVNENVKKELHNISQLNKMLNKNYHVVKDKMFNFRDKNIDKKCSEIVM